MSSCFLCVSSTIKFLVFIMFQLQLMALNMQKKLIDMKASKVDRLMLLRGGSLDGEGALKG